MISLDLGLGGGASLLTQTFTSDGLAPSRQTFAPPLAGAVGTNVELDDGFSVGLDVAAETHFIPIQETEHDRERTIVAFAVRSAL